MLRDKSKILLARPITYSVMLHLLLLTSSGISLLWSKEKSTLLMDIEIAGEGELKDALEQSQQMIEQNIPEAIKDIPDDKIQDNKLEEKNMPEAKLDEPKIVPEQNPDIDKNQLMEDEKNNIEEKSVEQPINEEQEKEEKSIDAKKEEEPVPKENTKKKIEEKPQEQKSKKQRKKKRDKKALMNVIKNAESKKKKQQEAAKNAARRKKLDSDFDKMLSKSSATLSEIEGKGSGKGKKGNGVGSFGTGNGLSEGDYDMISSQIYPHWVVPAGIRDAENIMVEISVELMDNGSVIPSSIKIVDNKRYATDYIFRAAADSARRAILEASPFKIPREKVEMFRKFTFRFNLREALGG